MSRVVAFWRSTPGGEGVNGVTISAYRLSDGALLDSDTTAGTGAGKGKAVLDVGYPGAFYITGTKDGTTLYSSSEDMGFAGSLSLYDLPDAFQVFSNGVVYGKDNACAV